MFSVLEMIMSVCMSLCTYQSGKKKEAMTGSLATKGKVFAFIAFITLIRSIQIKKSIIIMTQHDQVVRAVINLKTGSCKSVLHAITIAFSQFTVMRSSVSAMFLC